MTLRGATVRLLGVLCLAASVSFGQTAAGTISGTVVDESGAVIPGANVTVTNVNTGIRAAVASDGAGRYRLPERMPGYYEIQAQATGFQTEIRRGVQLTVGSEVVINLTLRVGQVQQTTVVESQAPLVETTTSGLSGLVDNRTIRDLPLNGRSFDQLISLQSSAPQFRLRDRGPLNGVSDVFTVSGARVQSNLFLMDGTEVVGAGSSTTMPGGVLGKNMGVDAVEEFSVLSSNYNAAYGKRAGGMVNVATRSGTNALHGSVFEFHRNDDVDARDFFDQDRREFKRNQFGGTLGGPLHRDQTFFFGNYEGLRERKGLTKIAIVPDENARQGILPPDLKVGVASSVKPFLVTFPPPNGRNFKDGTAESINAAKRTGDQDFFLVRMDHKLSHRDFLMGRYNFDRGTVFEPDDNPFFGAANTNRDQMVTLEEKRTYTRTVQVARFGYSRARVLTHTLPTIPLDPSLKFLPGADTIGPINFGSSSASGFMTPTGTGISEARRFVVNQFAAGEQLFHSGGAHSLQFGASLQRIQHNDNFANSIRGSFEFADLKRFLQGNPRRFRAPSPSGSGDAHKAYRQIYFAVYAQDDYKLKSNLTLNLGLRYEWMTVPAEASGNRISNFRTSLVNGLRFVETNPHVGSPFFQGHHNIFAPRIGFAWDVRGNGKTAVRGGFGMYYDQIENEFRFFTANNVPFFGLLDVSSPPFPLGFSGPAGQARTPAPDGIDFNLDVPTRLTWSLNIQRELTSNMVFAVAYVGAQAYHLTRQSDANTAAPQILAGGVKFYPQDNPQDNPPRKNPALGASRIISWDANSSYHSLQLDLIERLTHGLRYKASYTFAKSIDDATTIISNHALGNVNATQDPDNLRGDRGLSAFDVRHNFVFNFTYDLPWNHSSGAAGKLVGNWQAGAIVTLTSGTPFTALTGVNRSRDQARTIADRPDLRAGANPNPVLGGPDRYFDPSVFVLPPPGFYGNLGRNTLIAPGLEAVDFSLMKTIPLRERLKMDFRAEFFNLFNRANFGLPDNTVFNADGTVRGAAGRISNTITSSRQIQFGLKLLF